MNFEKKESYAGERREKLMNEKEKKKEKNFFKTL